MLWCSWKVLAGFWEQKVGCLGVGVAWSCFFAVGFRQQFGGEQGLFLRSIGGFRGLDAGIRCWGGGDWGAVGWNGKVLAGFWLGVGCVVVAGQVWGRFF